MKTVLEVITATTDYLNRNGVESARLNIEHLLAHVLKKRRMDLYMEFERGLTESELAPLRELVKRRVAGEPLQYLLGTWDFLSHTLMCDKRALIPRPETEELCEMLFAEVKGKGWKPARIVDVGTGSGCIALALAAAWPEAQVLAVDLSEDALALAQENAGKLGLAQRVSFLTSDLLTNIQGPFDLVVANLPYIPSAEMPSLQREVLREPHSALDGGPDGLAFVRPLVAQAAEKLVPGGRLALELHLGQPAAVAAILGDAFRDVRRAKDHSGRERFLLASRA